MATAFTGHLVLRQMVVVVEVALVQLVQTALVPPQAETEDQVALGTLSLLAQVVAEVEVDLLAARLLTGAETEMQVEATAMLLL